MAKITQTAGRNALGEFAPEFAHLRRGSNAGTCKRDGIPNRYTK